MVLHTTIGKRRSGAFKQKKVYQNRTIIKEVISKNVIFLLVLGSGPGDWTGPDPRVGQVRTPGLDPSASTTGPDPGVGQGGWTQGAGNRWYTQCYFSNFLLALALDGAGGLDGSGPGGWTGPDPGGLDQGGWTQVVHSMLLL